MHMPQELAGASGVWRVASGGVAFLPLAESFASVCASLPRWGELKLGSCVTNKKFQGFPLETREEVNPPQPGGAWRGLEWQSCICTQPKLYTPPPRVQLVVPCHVARRMVGGRVGCTACASSNYVAATQLVCWSCYMPVSTLGNNW